eukprot:TRINITY_DN1146_c0_g1_i1.p1 TRINITY_DN1146_c0_g1~~TRINITY_DN1146_c0_g1_i1.p1  ORF type:complete len:994 (-),score=203.04 TRINITY_DN1146_c0_g1_i1:316-3243(-)
MAAIRNGVFVLSLRQQVIFPAMRTSVAVSSQTFAQLCDFCEKHSQTHIAVLAAKDNKEEGSDELYSTGSWCRIASHAQSVTKAGNREVSVVTLSLEGQCRLQVKRFTQTSPFHVADIVLLDQRDPAEDSTEVKALAQSIQQTVQELLQAGTSRQVTDQESSSGGSLLRNLFGGKRVRWPASSSVLADMIAAGLSQLSMAERQQVLDCVELKPRLQLVLDMVQKVMEVQKLSREISSKIQKRSQDELRETVLKRQLSELQKEMRKLRSKQGESFARGDAEGEDQGEENENHEDDEEEEDEITVLRDSIKKAQLSAEANKIAQRELKRLQNIQPHHPEYSVCRNYLETLANLPWAESSKDDLDLSAASRILEKDHYGLDKVKRRILEFLAVQKMRGDMKGPILCLHGPPGVGKTSLGRSVAKALGRKFHRIALGGVRDEAEIRGHRRTYIGSMPGAIMQALGQLKVNNPVILLDEIDKLTRNAMFNPSGAMLELLDPEQNHTFKDHYVNTPFDLSKVLFLCTCNDLQSIDRPLLDRMEVIDLSGYTVDEKVHIATTHLLPKQRRLHALERDEPDQSAEEASQESKIGAESKESAEPEAEPKATRPEPEMPLLELTPAALQELITKWTAESGVRSLERRIAQVCRWTALRLAGATGEGEGILASRQQRTEAQRLAESALADCGPSASGLVTVDSRHLPHIVGAEIFEPDLAERLTVGVAMGLGVTATGGQLLFVEASRSKGSGRLTVTGQLGDVMKESVSTSMSLLRSKIYYAASAAFGPSPPVVRIGPSAEQTPASLVSWRPALSPAILTAAPSGASAEDTGSAGGFNQLFSEIIRSKPASEDPFRGDDVHVHFPAGAIPKDGPSAGVATTLALASLLLNKPVRSDTAVTGEITLRGHVLPVGGIRDKVLAAHRAGIRHVLVPFGNQRHVQEEISDVALGDVDVHFVKHIDEALAWAFGAEGPHKSWRPSAVPLSKL